MGHWDELCLICGVSPIPPSEIYTDPGFGAEDLVEKLQNLPDFPLGTFDDENGALEERLAVVLQTGEDYVQGDPGRLFFERPIAIGHFYDEYDTDVPSRWVPVDPHSGRGGYKREILPGRGVEVREVAEPMCGEFETSKVVKDGEERWDNNVVRTSSSGYLYKKCDSSQDGFGNFWVTSGCFDYLRAWINLPPTSNGLHDPPLTFAEEFYEVVNSRSNGRANGIGTLVGVDYEGTKDALDQTQYELFHLIKAPIELAKSILRQDPDDKILEAILRDCGFWRFASPQIWPEFSPDNEKDEEDEEDSQTRAPPPTPIPKRLTAQPGRLLTIPTEVFDTFLSHLDSIADYFTLAQTSTSLYHALMSNKSRQQHVFKRMTMDPSRCLYWIRPVSGTLDEDSKSEDLAARKALRTWIPEGHTVQDDGHGSPLDDHSFRWIPFLRACWASESMRNRRRLWRQVKRIEKLWRDYRLHGWEVDRFISLEQAGPVQ